VRGGFELAFSFTIVYYLAYIPLPCWFWVRPGTATPTAAAGRQPLTVAFPGTEAPDRHER
jgi:hypothetical protein